MKTVSTYRIYVASLAAYNAGKLHGEWIDIEGMDSDDIQEAINKVLETCPEHGEEWAIHDYELDGIKISENPNLDDLASLVEALAEHGEAFKVAYDNFGDVDQAKEAVEEHYQGCHRSLEDWAEIFAEETGMISKDMGHLANYIDWERYARDCEIGGDIWSASGDEGIHVFFNH